MSEQGWRGSCACLCPDADFPPAGRDTLVANVTNSFVGKSSILQALSGREHVVLDTDTVEII